MNNVLHIVAEVGAAEPSLVESLGINWQLLIIQTIAFLVLLWVLAKFVYPPLTQMLEKREAAIRESARAAHEAEQKADETKTEVARLLDEARKRASEIMAAAKGEAASVVEEADARATERAERIIAEAHAQIEKDIASAQKALRDETVELVAMATEKVVGKVVSPEIDKKVISSAIKETK